MWGHYPVLMDGLDYVLGVLSIMSVQSKMGRRSLGTNETNRYRIESCRKIYTDGKARADDFGRTFNFADFVDDLEEGDFDWTAWLRRIGRDNAADNVVTERGSASCTE